MIPKYETTEFKLDKLALSVLIDPKMRTFYDEDIGALSVQISAYIAAAQEQTKRIYVEVPKARFMDWLLQRKRIVSVAVTSKDVLLNPPPRLGDRSTIRFYKFEQTSD
jgi:hypothetical protein